MSRELKRVTLDFVHPLGEVWPGYVCDVGRTCSACRGRGTSSARDRLSDLVSLIMLSGDDARRGACHPYLVHAPLHATQGRVPSADMVALTGGLAGRGPSIFGHDCLDRHSATKKIIAAAGLPETWGLCEACEGHGDDPATRAAVEAWKRTEPPSGLGWQMWETVSEGSPISPVFGTAEELASWLATHEGESFDAWLRMILGPGWAPSVVVQDGRVLGGVEAVGGLHG